VRGPAVTADLAWLRADLHIRAHMAPARLAPIRAKRGMTQGELGDEERAALANHLERLREEHRDLDVAIEALRQAGQADQLQVQRLKKRKLALRDRLAQLEDALTPDIIA
jgi:hypothetical protein